MLDASEYFFPPRIGPYVFRGTIGEGAFSVVKLAIHEETKQFVACKIVPRARLNSEDLEERFEIEIRVNQQLHHPGIVQVLDLLKDDKNYYIFMEYCPNGEIFGYIVDRHKLSENEGKKFFKEVVEALAYIHSQNIAHRDLKPENLLLDPDVHVKISDFGLSKFVTGDGLVETPCGSPCYASPECLSGEPYDGRKSDIWSLGVILFAMVTGQLPWTKRNQTQLFAQIRRGEYIIPKFLSESCKSIIRGMLTVDNEKRLTIPQLLDHPWLADIKSYTTNQFDHHLPIVSIKKVDDFFGHVIEPIEYSEEKVSYQENCRSTVRLPFDKTTKMLLGKVKVKGTNSFATGQPDTLNAKVPKRPVTVQKVRTQSKIVKPKIDRRSVKGSLK